MFIFLPVEFAVEWSVHFVKNVKLVQDVKIVWRALQLRRSRFFLAAIETVRLLWCFIFLDVTCHCAGRNKMGRSIAIQPLASLRNPTSPMIFSSPGSAPSGPFPRSDHMLPPSGTFIILIRCP